MTRGPYGTKRGQRPLTATESARFWSKVDRSGPDDCWPWLAGCFDQGYGAYAIDLRNRGAHVVAWEQEHGPVPQGKQLDHTCHTRDLTCRASTCCQHRRCCNPAHLEPVTAQTNTLRGRTLPAENAAKTHCPQDHPLSGDNLYVTARRRTCKICNRAKQERYKAKNRGVPIDTERAGAQDPCMPNDPPLLSPSEVAAAFQVHPATVRRWALDGKIAAIMTPGGRRKYRRSDIEAMLIADVPVEPVSAAS